MVYYVLHRQHLKSFTAALDCIGKVLCLQFFKKVLWINRDSTMTTLTDCTIASTASDNNNVKPLSEVISTSSVQSPTTQRAPVPQGPRHKLITEADVQVCRLNHTRTIVSKIMNSRYLRRWECHKIVLDDNEIRSSTVSTNFFPLPYTIILLWYICSQTFSKHILRLLF